ncbi:MAG: FAD-dependent oxidoreductase [Actinomycetales bacterium]|nr:FAD-dependent oxidoreductase [Actinomycetales bacterium]
MVPPLGSRRGGPHPLARRAAYRSRSLWLDQAHLAGDPLTPRAALDADTEVDVVVVGGGLTGLWTAYYLTEWDPALSVLVLEAEIAGFGASGRNGGWCSALLPTSAEAMAAEHGADAARAMRAAMRGTVREVGDVAAREGIECDFTLGGTVALARSGPQLARARAEATAAAPWGDEVTLLDARGTAEVVRARGALGATYTPDCARLQPAHLVRGLARVVEARGVRIAEWSRAVEVAPHRVTVEVQHDVADSGPTTTDSGSVPSRRFTVRARHVVRATEAWTAHLAGSRRAVAPVYSLMIATEPLPAAFWDEVGLARYETFTDHRHLIVYGQRTADDRLAFGGRGAPYHWGSAIEPGFDHVPRVFSALRRTLVDFFPAARDAQVTHAWGGPLGIARDWHASVGLDPATGTAWAGGYVGDGLSTTNLAGRTLADLITGTDSAVARLPWVGHRSPRWEPEPWRWLGINTGLRLAVAADAEERLTRRPSVLAHALSSLTGH